MRPLTTVIIALSAILFPPHAVASTHPINAQGYVTDGSPQLDDAHCSTPPGSGEGSPPASQVACLVARRPECIGTQAMSRQQAMQRWAPMINVYPWPHLAMFDTLYCESKGKTNASNGSDVGLLQETAGTGDPVHDINLGYTRYWLGQGPAAWPNTYGVYCAD
jgi:hypothetical protein